MNHRLVFLLVLGLNTVLLTAQSFYFQQYSVGNGLPQSQVYALLHDSRGYLWLGTQGGGLARFDGKNFQTYTVRNGLSDNHVQALLEDPDGNIWVGTNRGLCRFDGRRFSFFELKKGEDIPVFALTFREKTLWIASQSGIFKLQNGQTTQVPDVGGQPVGRLTATLTDRRGKTWMGGDEGLFKLENGTWTAIQRRKAEVLALHEMPDGKILVGIFNSGILILDGKKRSFVNTASGLPSNKVQCFWQQPGRPEVWVGTQDAGVCRWNPQTGAFTQISENQGLCNRNVRSMLGDDWGKVIWFGTSGGGACKYAARSFEHFDTDDGLRSNFVYAVCEGKNRQGLWLSAGDRGISYRGPANPSVAGSPDTLLHFGLENGFYNVKCRALFRDRSDRIWIGTEGLGLAVYADSVFHFFSKKNGLAGNWIRDIAEDPAGNLWVATTDGGISKISFPAQDFARPVFKNYGLQDGLPDLTVHALHFDKKGRLWFATQQAGIGFFENGTFKSPLAESNLKTTTVRSLAEDAYGNLWAGTAGRGIGRLNLYFDKSLDFRLLTQNDSLTSANVYLLQFDDSGNLWVGSETGVDRLATDSTGRILSVRHFGRTEGFLGVETCQNASLRSTGGGLWFGTVNGLTHYLPLSDSLHGGAPRLGFTGIRLFYEPLESSEQAQWATHWGGLKTGAVFPHDQNHLGFEFLATDFKNPDKVTYSWRLVGSETDWSPFAARTEVSYAGLPPGEYRFRVRAMGEDGVVSAPVEAAFRIEPPFWATWRFRLAAAAVAALLVFGLFKWRIRRVQRKAAQERAQLELQNRLLTLEQKARQLQMNPHFIFNALNSIQSLVSAGNMDSARQYILKFGRLMRAVLDNSRQPLIPLEKEIETLRQYLEMEQFCREGKFDFEIRAEAVVSEDIQLPPMLLQPFVENAILHGIGPLSGKKGLISVEFAEQKHLLEVCIRDNGIGIEQSQARKSGEDGGRRSAGIAVTRERLELLKNEAGFQEPAVEIRQLTDAGGEVEGTEVVVRVGSFSHPV